METSDLHDLRNRVVTANDWNHADYPVTDLVYAVHVARVRMGAFNNPLKDPETGEVYEPELIGLTLSEWHWIQAQRQTLAVLDWLIKQRQDIS